MLKMMTATTRRAQMMQAALPAKNSIEILLQALLAFMQPRPSLITGYTCNSRDRANDLRLARPATIIHEEEYNERKLQILWMLSVRS